MRRRRLLRPLAIFVAAGVILFGFATVVSFGSDTGPIGARANDLLRGPFFVIGFEIDYQPGASPDKVQVDRFLDFVERYTGKATSVGYRQLPPGDDDVVTMDEASAIAVKNRDSFSSLFWTLSVHILYLDAAIDGKDTAGFSFQATSIVILGKQIPDGFVEAAVLAHEFGHLMGLCGLYSQSDLCDGDGHAVDPQSLMAQFISPYSQNVKDLVLTDREVALLSP